MKRLVLPGLALLWLWAGPVPAQPASGDEIPDDTVLMSRGEVSVTYGDWQAHLRSFPEEGRPEILVNPLLMAKVMDSLWTWKVLAQQAREAGYDRNPEAQADVAYAAEKALGKAWLYEARRSAPPADYTQMAREHYILNPADYNLEETVRVSHILVSTENRSDDEALTRAREVRELILAGEIAFEELALEYSDDSTVRHNGGRLASQPRGRWVGPFDEVAFAMTEPGEVSPPVRTRYGYHVIVFGSREPAKNIPFEEVREMLEAHFEAEYRDGRRLRRAEAAKDAAGRELNVEALRAIMPLDALSAPQVFEQAEREEAAAGD